MSFHLDPVSLLFFQLSDLDWLADAGGDAAALRGLEGEQKSCEETMFWVSPTSSSSCPLASDDVSLQIHAYLFSNQDTDRCAQ
jgi:hypothetical protein